MSHNYYCQTIHPKKNILRRSPNHFPLLRIEYVWGMNSSSKKSIVPFFIFLVGMLLGCSNSNPSIDVVNEKTYSTIKNFETLHISKDVVEELSALNMGSITIGEIRWKKKNLNVKVFSNGDKILKITSHDEWEKAAKSKTPAYCSMNFDEKNDSVFGKLYNWFAVNDERGLASKEWHVASKEEWGKLIVIAGGIAKAGSVLKKKGDDLWLNQSPTEAISLDLYLLPGGYQYDKGHFGHIGKYGYWWTSTKFDKENSWFVKVGDSSPEVLFDRGLNGYGVSVRCVKNTESQ